MFDPGSWIDLDWQLAGVVLAVLLVVFAGGIVVGRNLRGDR